MDLIKFIIDPVVAILLLLLIVAAGSFQQQGKTSYCLLAASVVLYFSSTPILSNNFLHYVESVDSDVPGTFYSLSDTNLADKQLDIILLAGGISTTQSPGERFELTTSGDRVLLAAQFARLNSHSQIWFAEDQSKKQTSSILNNLGILGSRLKSLPAASNTWEELKTITQHYQPTSNEHVAVFITSAYHVNRVSLIANHLGVPTNFAAANHIGKKSNINSQNILPGVIALSGTTKALREWIAMKYYTLRIRFS